MSAEQRLDENKQTAPDAPSLPQKVQLLWPPPMLRNDAQSQSPQQSLVNLVACKRKCSIDNGDGDGNHAFPPGVGLYHQNGRIVFDKTFYTTLADPSKETQDVLCEYVQSSCQEQGFFVRRKQYAKPESNRSKTWRLRLRCKKTSCSFKMNFCWDVEKQYWFIPTGKDGDFVHKCGWTGPPSHALTVTAGGTLACSPCTPTSSSSSSAVHPIQEVVSSVPMNRASSLPLVTSAAKRVMRLPLSRKKKKAKSGDAVPVTLSPYGDAYSTQTAMPCTKPVTPTPSVYGDVHSSSHHFETNGHSNGYMHNNQNRNHGNRRLSASFSARRFRPAIRNTSHNHSAADSDRFASVSPIEPPPFPKTNKKPQEPLQIISAAPPQPDSQHDDDRDAAGDEDYLSATLEDMDISDNEEGSHADIMAAGDLKRLFTNEDEEPQHLATTDAQQLGEYNDASVARAYNNGPAGNTPERRQEDTYSSQQYSSSSSLFYQLQQQAVDYCSQPYTTASNVAAAPTRYFSWNFMDYCCAAPGTGGASDYYDSNQYNNNNNSTFHQQPESQQQQQPQQYYQDDASATAGGKGGPYQG